jgi:cysteine-rich repeat protein
MRNQVCTDYCIEECPDGWTCKMLEMGGPDPVYVCISDFSHLCVPCGESSDCSMYYVKNVCIQYPGIGAFCGASCDAANPCPEGYLCQDAMSTEGTVTKQCVATDGECDCTDWAIKLAMGTAGEQCDDGNSNGGDGCSATCQNESPCPVGTAYIQGYCWVKAIAWEETHSAACSRVGKSTTSYYVDMTWDNNVLTQVAAVWGFTSIGKYECCAHAMWCNNGTKQCGTHNFGSPFENYQKYGDSNWWPVYTCKP